MRILMLGNSFTSTNHLPEKLAARLNAQVIAHTRGSARLSEHLNPKTKLGARTQAALREEKWDYVVLQEMSSGPIVSRERFLSSVSQLCRQIRANGAVPVLYATWSYAPGHPRLDKLGLTAGEMTQRLTAAYHEAAQASQALVAEAGEAFLAGSAGDNLYAADGVHPNAKGAAVAAEAIARAIEANEMRF